MQLNKITIESKLNIELNQDKININLNELQEIVNFCFNNVIFDFTSQIDDILIKIANQNIIPLDQDFFPNSFLHVFSQVYLEGGHTRVGERWIKYSPDSQKHSVVITKQENMPIPDLLKQVVKDKNGDFVVFENKNPIELALDLRKIANKYEFIILHIHMNDLIPIIAFGAENFNRKILFFNHADHEFWIGGKITNLVVNLRTFVIKINKQLRNIYRNVLLPLPIEKPSLDFDDDEALRTKQELGIDRFEKVIITIASAYKYKNFDEYNWIETAKKILDKNLNSVIVAIGPSMQNEEWRLANKDTGGRIIPLGIIANNMVEKYLKIADLAIDSYPFSSFIALLDVAKYNIECLSLKTPINYLDSFLEAKIYCNNQNTLVERATTILQKPKKNSRYTTKLYRIIEEKHFPNAFIKNIDLIYKTLDKSAIKSNKKNLMQKSKYVDKDIMNFLMFNRKIKGVDQLLLQNHIKKSFVAKLKNSCIKKLLLQNHIKKSFVAKFKNSCIKRIKEIKNLINLC